MVANELGRTTINACEDGFEGMIKWPSLEGTFEAFVQAIETLQVRDSGQLVTVGLRSDFDESVNLAIDCCEYMGEVTGLIHMLGNKSAPAGSEDAKQVWERVVEIDAAGRKQGFYALETHCNWLNVI